MTQEVMELDEELLKVSEVARRTGVCRETINRWVAQQKLDVRRLGPRSIRITASSYRRLLASQNPAPAQPVQASGIVPADVPA